MIRKPEKCAAVFLATNAEGVCAEIMLKAKKAHEG